MLDLPLEMLELILMRTFLMLYMTEFGEQAFTVLSSVCWSWYQTLVGWPESPTRHWLRHQLKKAIERKYTILVPKICVSVTC